MSALPPAEQKTLLLLLFAPGETGDYSEPITGKTRLMKEAFLLDHEGSSDEPLVHPGPFIPYKYGPFSVKVATALDDLSNMGLVLPSKGDESTITFVLSAEGRKEAGELWAQMPPDAKRDLLVVKSSYNRQPLTSLLHYVYSKYPEYTVESELREQLVGSD
ncbi:MAG: hypothetical protein WAK40_00815 [Thermoplasmata archaeon]|jgi:uncharacterized protein YwgA